LESGLATPSGLFNTRVMDEIDRSEIGRRERVHDDGVGPRAREDSGVAEINAALAAEFGAEADSVERRAGVGLVDEIGLVERCCRDWWCADRRRD